LLGPTGDTPPDARPGIVSGESLRNAPWRVVLPTHAGSESLMGHALLACAITGGVLGVLAWGVGRSVRIPLDQLTAHAERLASGDLSRPVPIAGDDEIGRLGDAFERMRQALDRSMQALADSNSQLEARVADRTAALGLANATLEARDRQRARLLRQVITAQEDERRRLARELHDDTCQAIAALTLRLDMALASTPDDSINPEVIEARLIAGRTLDDVHRLIHDLRPTALDELGLVAALQRVIDRHLAPTGVVARLETDDWPARLPYSIETPLFRAAQEAIVNVARHGHAEHVLVQCRADDRRLTIEVEDDGCGFSPASVSVTGAEDARGLGLLGMRERIASIDGTVTIESAPDRGTRIVLEAPRQTEGA
jgi:signal transduction histidine kinase